MNQLNQIQIMEEKLMKENEESNDIDLGGLPGYPDYWENKLKVAKMV